MGRCTSGYKVGYVSTHYVETDSISASFFVSPMCHYSGIKFYVYCILLFLFILDLFEFLVLNVFFYVAIQMFFPT